MREVVDRPKEGGRDAEGNTYQHGRPCAVVAGQENSEHRKQHCREDAAEDEGSATVVVHGGLCISMK